MPLRRGQQRRHPLTSARRDGRERGVRFRYVNFILFTLELLAHESRSAYGQAELGGLRNAPAHRAPNN